MNAEMRIEVALRRRPSDEREYEEPLRAVATDRRLGRARTGVRLRARVGGVRQLAALGAVAVLCTAALGLAVGLALQNNGHRNPAPAPAYSGSLATSPASSATGGEGTLTSATPGSTATPGSSGAASWTPEPTATPGPTFMIYVVRSGDTLSKIAAQFNVSLSSLLAANPYITNPNHIVVGQRIFIPWPTWTPPPAAPTPSQ
jgi:LysM repeat protein